MDTMQVITTRKTCRAFTDEPVTKDQIRTILEAANASPIAMHDFEAVQLSVIADRKAIDAIDALAGANGGRMGTGPTYKAPVLILVSGSEDGMERGTNYCNAGCIIENMQLAATELGLGSGYILGVIKSLQQHPEMFAALGVDEGFVPVSAMTLGHPADADLLAGPREATTENIITHFIE
ncbi:nitroreductase family protein [Bifidobacterium simiarum]|uniref:nitroreductase family protein n=1 Tax=Bifidobacterium simiarum TaxID=2045441 RepID=UPI001BDBDF21|nr:nitroreductase family protein [Bifidobacterium simiarum]MBT1166401.1 nitroreductase family protein [Bifidobacterium simiarum]